MSDLISRQAAIDAIANCTNCGDEKTLRAYVQKHNLDNGWTGGVLEAIDAIEDLSSAEPEIIYCKDCKYVGTDATCCLVCDREGMGLKPYYVRKDDYCSYAERRTDGSD